MSTTYINPDRREARIKRDELDLILQNLAVAEPWHLSTHAAIATLFNTAANYAGSKKAD